MKKLFTNFTLTFLCVFVLSALFPIFGQEYDDLYFRKKDRNKTGTERIASAGNTEVEAFDHVETVDEQVFDKNANPDYLASENSNTDDQETVYFEEGYERQDLSNMNDAGVVVKHYYYGYPTTTYYSTYDAAFWSDPFLYQGTIFDPFYDPFYRHNRYYRPGWNVTVRMGGGYGYGGYNHYHSSYYGGYNSYGYGWGSYYDPWYGYYDPFWCPPSYYNYNNVIVVSSNEGRYYSRGVVRGKRSSRSSTYAGRSSRSSSSGRGTGIADNDSQNGRIDGSAMDSKNPARRSRAVNEETARSNYSDFRTTRKNGAITRSSSGIDYRDRNESNRTRNSSNYSRTSRTTSNSSYRPSSRSSSSSNRNNSTYTNRSNNRSRSNSSYNSSGSRSSRSSSSGSSSYSRSSKSSSSGSSRSSSRSGSSRKRD